MLVLRWDDAVPNSKPILNEANLAEGHRRLHHTERAWVHPEEYDAFTRVSKACEVLLVCFPGVFKRIVNVRDRRWEIDSIQALGELLSRLDDGG